MPEVMIGWRTSTYAEKSLAGDEVVAICHAHSQRQSSYIASDCSGLSAEMTTEERDSVIMSRHVRIKK